MALFWRLRSGGFCSSLPLSRNRFSASLWLRFSVLTGAYAFGHVSGGISTGGHAGLVLARPFLSERVVLILSRKSSVRSSVQALFTWWLPARLDLMSPMALLQGLANIPRRFSMPVSIFWPRPSLNSFSCRSSSDLRVKSTGWFCTHRHRPSP